jgi:hydroxymethylpyrimidine/phosphomethylpyrimidine kinase
VHHFHTLYREVEKRTVLDQLTAAARRLEEAHAGALIPEVQSNLGMGLTGARTFDDVAAFPGRLIRLHRDIRSVAPPEFAASTHVAKIVLTAMEHDPDKRAVMNIRYEEEMLAACRALNLSIASFDRHEEPKDVKNLEGSSLEWGTAQVIRETGEVPDIIYDIGDEGKEPMIRILGRDPGRIVDIALAILERVRG